MYKLLFSLLGRVQKNKEEQNPMFMVNFPNVPCSNGIGDHDWLVATLGHTDPPCPGRSSGWRWRGGACRRTGRPRPAGSQTLQHPLREPRRARYCSAERTSSSYKNHYKLIKKDQVQCNQVRSFFTYQSPSVATLQCLQCCAHLLLS